jgi:hypothetical protein
VPPDFLNSREDAMVFWAVVILGFAVYKNPRGIGSASADLARTALHPKLLFLFSMASAYCAALVYGAQGLGLWHTPALKATTYWFIGTGVALIGGALSGASPQDPEFLRRVLRRVVAITFLTDFAMNLYALPFIVEATILFVALLFVAMQAVLAGDPSVGDALTRKFVENVLVVIGLFYFGYFLIRVFSDFGGFLTRDHAEEFLVGPVLTIALIPFLYAVAWCSQRELANLRKQFSL